MRSINRNSCSYFMGFNACRTHRATNPFHFPSKAANDWLKGYIDAFDLKEAAVD